MSKVSLVGLMLTLVASAYPTLALGQTMSQGCGCSNVRYQPVVSASQAYPCTSQLSGSIQPMASQPVTTTQSYQPLAATNVQNNQSQNYRRFSYQPAPTQHNYQSNYGNQRYLYPKADHRRYDTH